MSDRADRPSDHARLEDRADRPSGHAGLEDHAGSEGPAWSDDPAWLDDPADSEGPARWEEHAGWWQDEFTEGADPEYVEQILPLIEAWLPPGGRVLDVGTGEGQVARLAAGGGRPVVGVDPAWAQVREAVRRGRGRPVDPGNRPPANPRPGPPVDPENRPSANPRPGPPVDPGNSPLAGWGPGPLYARALAGALPLRGATFDAVVACLVFEHVRAVDEAIAEVARVLVPGGRFLLLLNHPLLQTPGSGWIDDHILDEQYWRIGPYLVEDETLEEVEKNVFIPFVHRPLSRYVNALADNGLSVVRMEEPAPPAGFLARAFEYGQAATIPRLLMIVAEKR